MSKRLSQSVRPSAGERLEGLSALGGLPTLDYNIDIRVVKLEPDPVHRRQRLASFCRNRLDFLQTGICLYWRPVAWSICSRPFALPDCADWTGS